MSCSNIDVKAWMLGEVDHSEKVRYEQHLVECQDCRQEFDRLQLTHSALLALPDEEIPQRIAFVSDRVFEPTWWQRVWHSGPAMGLASAALLSGAILFHGITRPAPPAAPVAQIDTTQLEQRITQQVDQRIHTAVAKAVADIESREDSKHQQILAAAERKSTIQGQALASAQQTIRLYQYQMGRMMVAANTSPNNESGSAR
jgi:hypothetical protein